MRNAVTSGRRAVRRSLLPCLLLVVASGILFPNIVFSTGLSSHFAVMPITGAPSSAALPVSSSFPLQDDTDDGQQQVAPPPPPRSSHAVHSPAHGDPEVITDNVTITGHTRWDHRTIILQGNIHLSSGSTLVMNHSVLLFQRISDEDRRKYWLFSASPNTTFIMDNQSYLGVVTPPHWDDPENRFYRWDFDGYRIHLNGTRVILKNSEVSSAGYIRNGPDEDTFRYRDFFIHDGSEVLFEEMRFTNNFNIRITRVPRVVVVRSEFANTHLYIADSWGVIIKHFRSLLFVNNTISRFGYGVKIGSLTEMSPPVDRAFIADNYINYTALGIILENLRSKPGKTLIFRNTLENIREWAISIWISTVNVTAWNNRISFFRWDEGVGMLITESAGVNWPDFNENRNLYIRENVIDGGGVGVILAQTRNVTVEGNWIMNSRRGIVLWGWFDPPGPDYPPTTYYPRNTVLFNNSFLNISYQPELRAFFNTNATTVHVGHWGNYWEAHAQNHSDMDGDGIIDVPYVLWDNGTPSDPSDDLVDPYPLAHPRPIPWVKGYPAPWDDFVRPYFPRIRPDNKSNNNNSTTVPPSDEGDGSSAFQISFASVLLMVPALVLMTVLSRKGRTKLAKSRRRTP